MYPSFRTLALLLVLSGAAQAQTALTDQRQILRSVDSGGASISHYGYFTAGPNAAGSAGELTWYYESPGGGQIPPLHLALPLDKLGDILTLSSTDYLLVGRRTTGSGMVGHATKVHLTLSPPSMTIVGSTDIAGVDPRGVCWDALTQQLFLLDGEGRRVVHAPWNGSSPTLPGTFSQVVDYTTFGALARPNLTAITSGGGLPGVRVYEQDGVQSTRFYLEGGAWLTDVASWDDSMSRPVVTGTSVFVPDGDDWHIRVLGPASFPITGRIRAEGGVNHPITLTGPETVLAPPPGLQTPGDFGSLRVPGLVSYDFRTYVRYGEPQPNGFPLGEIYCDVYGAYEGRDDLVVMAEVLPDPVDGVVLPAAVTGELRIGVRNASGTDPVYVNGDLALLVPVQTVPFQVPAGTLPTELSFKIDAIPANSEGMVILYQVVVFDGEDTAYTNVFGQAVRAHHPYGE